MFSLHSLASVCCLSALFLTGCGDKTCASTSMTDCGTTKGSDAVGAYCKAYQANTTGCTGSTSAVFNYCAPAAGKTAACAVDSTGSFCCLATASSCTATDATNCAAPVSIPKGTSCFASGINVCCAIGTTCSANVGGCSYSAALTAASCQVKTSGKTCKLNSSSTGCVDDKNAADTTNCTFTAPQAAAYCGNQ